jgi:RNA polymerase sigma factor (sigma-70 family)
MSESGSVSEWIEDLRAGKVGAATQLWNRFHANLMKIARRRLSASARRATDEEDLVAIAFESFFERFREGQFPDLRGRAELWSLLVTITDRKAVNHVRQHFSAKRGSGRVVAESALGRRAESGASATSLQARVDVDAPQPDRVASLAELFDRLDADLRRIVLMKRDGFTNEEISRRVNRSVATIERRLRLLRDEWMEELFG